MRAAILAAAAAATMAAAQAPIYDFFQSQLNATLASLPNPSSDPSGSIFPNEGSGPGKYPWSLTSAGGWVSGFFAGVLWKMYNHTGSPYWRDVAIPWTSPLAVNEFNTGTHDVGFIVFTSFGQQTQLTANATSHAITLRTAQSLSTRFVASVGCIESWGVYPPPNGIVEVIIDNMMNLELLWWSAQNNGSSTYYDMAVSHSDRMIQDAFQPFNSGCVWHLMQYNFTTGALLNRSSTPQGLGLNTIWARGQGWATMGFTIAYRYSLEPRYLVTAQAAADCFIRQLQASAVSSEDFIPLWDFNATAPNLYGRDTSAAVIAADGMIEIAWHTADPNQASQYLAAAKRILDSATTKYMENPAASPAFMNNGTSTFPDTGIPIIYGDYYLLEAQMKWDATAPVMRHAAAAWAAAEWGITLLA